MAQQKTRKRNQMRKGPNGGMELVLIEDVAHVGKRGDVVEVKPGYGRNYLLPQSLALVPTEGNMKLLARYKIKVQQALEAKMADLRVLAGQIQRLDSIVIEAQANENAVLYGSVGPQEIAKALRSKNLMIDPSMVALDEHFKDANRVYDVPLHLGHGIDASIKVTILAAAE